MGERETRAAGSSVVRDAGSGSVERWPAVALDALVLCIVLAGAISGGLARSLVQLVPAIVALLAVQRRRAWALYATIPIFVFWLVMVAVTWFAWLGVVPAVLGHPSAAALGVLTVAGAAALGGLAAVAGSRAKAGLLPRLGAFWLLALLQVAALWLSLQPWLSRG